ncbi:MAG: type II toxin-antitoxin system RelE/ParE family toxin [Candidatus Saccharimonadales bacterium]
MKPIIRDKQFVKSYKSRVAPNKRLAARFDERLKLFASGQRGTPLNDHGLKGKKLGLRAFSIAGDARVVYYETKSEIILLDVGTHNQVY